MKKRTIIIVVVVGIFLLIIANIGCTGNANPTASEKTYTGVDTLKTSFEDSLFWKGSNPPSRWLHGNAE